MRDLVQPVASQPWPQPRFAERVRTLVHVGRVGSLSTLSRKQEGFPFGSVMPYGLDDAGHPIFLISTMAMHTQNLQAEPRASLLITPTGIHRRSLGFIASNVVGKCFAGTRADVAEGAQALSGASREQQVLGGF